MLHVSSEVKKNEEGKTYGWGWDFMFIYFTYSMEQSPS
jgi:hypothetical protein